MSSLPWVYAFAFINASLSHFVSWIVSLTTVIVPMLFKQRFLETLHPANVFCIPLPWSGLTVNTVADGVHVFLRWDYIIGSAGVLIWAIFLHTVAHRQILGMVPWTSLLFKIAILSAVAGPAGAAVELVWERDELVFSETSGTKQQISTSKKSN